MNQSFGERVRQNPQLRELNLPDQQTIPLFCRPRNPLAPIKGDSRNLNMPTMVLIRLLQTGLANRP